MSRDMSIYDKYYKKGGTYELPIEVFNDLIDEIDNLRKENEELKKNQRYYKNGVFSLEYTKETLSDMVDDYKSRCEKAIEYNEHLIKHAKYHLNLGHLKKMRNILNGSDDR